MRAGDVHAAQANAHSTRRSFGSSLSRRDSELTHSTRHPTRERLRYSCHCFVCSAFPDSYTKVLSIYADTTTRHKLHLSTSPPLSLSISISLSLPPHPVPPPPLPYFRNPCRQPSTSTTQADKSSEESSTANPAPFTHTHLFLVGGDELAEKQSPRGVHSRVRQKALRRRALDHALLPVQRHLRSRRHSNRYAKKNQQHMSRVSSLITVRSAVPLRTVTAVHVLLFYTCLLPPGRFFQPVLRPRG